jgi:hypothetical protein
MAYDYSKINGNITKLGNLSQKLKNVRDSWDEAVDSKEPFYEQFKTKINTLITNVDTYKGWLETKGKTLQKYAKWSDKM